MEMGGNRFLLLSEFRTTFSCLEVNINLFLPFSVLDIQNTALLLECGNLSSLFLDLLILLHKPSVLWSIGFLLSQHVTNASVLFSLCKIERLDSNKYTLNHTYLKLKIMHYPDAVLP